MKAKNTIRNTGTINNSGILHVGDRTTIRIAKGTRRAVPHPDGSIGSNLPMRNYIQYLVGRYHDYREADERFGRTGRIHYAVIFKNVEAKFKAPTYFIPESRFEELADYLQSKIDTTILGRRNNSRGIRNFESFDEYKMKHMANPKT